MNQGHASLSEWGFSHITLSSDARVLDVGCGGGANIAKLLELVPQGFVDGIDHSPESVAMSKKINKAELGKRCAITLGDVGNLPYADNTFDAVTAFETVYFWPDLENAFVEIRRVLKPGGTFLVVLEASDPSDTTWTDRIDGMTIYSGADLEGRLKKAGFMPVSLHELENGWISMVAEVPRS
jgi:ubiquinone/menaquinone biosynthesis C-methylase UbiE